MGIENERNDLRPGPREIASGADQGLVAAMDPVKIADGECWAAAHTGGTIRRDGSAAKQGDSNLD
jgi:hypothetical protein